MFSVLIRIELFYFDCFILKSNIDFYNSLISSHGIAMIFFFLMPIFLGAFGNIFIPIAQGIMEVSFPRINNLAFYLLLFSSFFFIISFFYGKGINVG